MLFDCLQKGELNELCSKASGPTAIEITESGFERGNYFVQLKKVS
jgi:hypothetical protein